jgi:spore maturation protein SpmB
VSTGDLFHKGVIPGLRNGWDGFVWMMKIIVPISFLTELLAWSGWLQKAEFIFRPFMAFMSLPAMAAYPLLIGVTTNIYGGIAVMAVLPFTKGEMTLIALFLLIAHNMVQEGIIQGKSGINPWKATFARLFTATLTVAVLAPLLVVGEPSAAAAPVVLSSHSKPLQAMMLDWAWSMLDVGVKILLIILVIMTFLEVMKVKGWINGLVRFLSPVLRVMGLSREVGFVWLTGAIFGLAYGGSVIIQESRAGHLSREDIETLHLSIGINHAMVEDPALFLSLGLSPFWLWVPRIIVAIIMTRLFTLWRKIAHRRTAS